MQVRPRRTMTELRPEQPDDYAAIDEVNRAAFGQEAEGRLVAAIRDADGFDPALSLVAIRDNRVVGHILFSPILIETDAGDVPALALAPMAVLPEYQRRGIGSELVRGGLDACRERGHRIVVVLGHPDFYPRFGFTPAGRHGVRCPFDVPEEVFVVLGLHAGALCGTTGVVRYPPAFNEV